MISRVSAGRERRIVLERRQAAADADVGRGAGGEWRSDALRARRRRGAGRQVEVHGDLPIGPERAEP